MRGGLSLGGIEIVDPRATVAVTSPASRAGEADFPPIGNPSLSSDLTSSLLREGAGRPNNRTDHLLQKPDILTC
jgi:hypothetical protein